MPHVACPACGAALAIPELSSVISFHCPCCQKILRLNRRSGPGFQKPTANRESVPSISATPDRFVPATSPNPASLPSGPTLASSVSPPGRYYSPMASVAHRVCEGIGALLNRARCSPLIGKTRRLCIQAIHLICEIEFWLSVWRGIWWV